MALCALVLGGWPIYWNLRVGEPVGEMMEADTGQQPEEVADNWGLYTWKRDFERATITVFPQEGKGMLKWR